MPAGIALYCATDNVTVALSVAGIVIYAQSQAAERVIEPAEIRIFVNATPSTNIFPPPGINRICPDHENVFATTPQAI